MACFTDSLVITIISCSETRFRRFVKGQRVQISERERLV